MKIDHSMVRCLLVMFLLTGWMTLAAGSVLAADTTIGNIREGLHAQFTRIVLDCTGEPPRRIGPPQTRGISVRFDDLSTALDFSRISSRLQGAVEKIEQFDEASGAEVRLFFRTPSARVKTLVLPPTTERGNGYRLVLDIYAGQPTEEASGTAQPAPATQDEPAGEAPAAAFAPEAAAQAATAESLKDAGSAPAGQAPSPPVLPADEPAELAAAPQKEAADEESQVLVSGEASLILRASDGEDDSAKFEEYRDITAPVAGDLSLSAEKDRDYYLQGKALGIGQDDPYVDAEAGRYGKFGIDATWEKIIHRYAYDARTLYSGVGSGYMQLDDNLQANVQAAPNSVETANRLNGFLPGAVDGDPETTRDQRRLGFDLTAFDPFTLRIDLANEKREGARPFAGAFSNSEMVELFEPVDYDTNEMKISGEYLRAPFLLNFAYHFSQFENNRDTLRFDNPLRATDAVGGPASGIIDLAPDNQYHNFSVGGALTHLPWRSQISANAAWGRMTQDDALVTFTDNTDITAPTLPTDRVDARVDTSLYNFRLTSRPLSFMRVKGTFRYYDYDNRTGVIDFADGYVETDESLVPTAIRNLPTSYTKTQAGGDLGFDVFTRSNLNLGYEYEHTERDNREVGEQEDHIMKASLDTRALDWVDLRAAYTRTLRDIGDYRYDVYLNSGDDLEQLPQLRKYDQADLTRDLIDFMATIYPAETLAFRGSLTYGQDDFQDSPYGLTEDNHYIFSFDADYALAERLTLNLFYIHEIYESQQRDRQNGGGTEFDWAADGKDLVDTIGGGFKLALVPDALDLDLDYAFSEVDGNLEFSSPSGAFADFSAVDDTRTHMLNTQLIYHNALGFDVAVGYLWEKFDYTDFAADGFSAVPTDAAGNYQGALLAGTLPQDYDAHVIYTKITFRYH